jgi:hypothetical protein
MATQVLSVNVKQALGVAFIEVLTGNLTDETIQAVDNIQRDEVPANLVDVYHAIRGASLHPIVREGVSRLVLGEFYSAAKDAHMEHLK